MTADELLVRLVLNYGNPTGGKNPVRAALLVNVGGEYKDWRVEYKAKDPGAPPPAAKILTTVAKELDSAKFLNNYCMVLNYKATDWCLGLAWLLQVKYVVYLDGGIKAVKTSTDAAGKDGFPAWKMTDWNWNCTYSQEKGRFTFGADAKRYPSVRDREDKVSIQAIIASAGTAKVIDKIAFTGVSFSPPPIPREGFIPMPGNAYRNDLFIRAAFALVNRTWKHGGGRDEGLSGHNIGGIAVGQDDRILGWAVNVSEVSRCFHAESLLVVKLLGSGVDLKNIKLRIYCTLEPCQMCAGLISTMCPGTSVFYGMPDPKIANNSLARKRNGCTQQLSDTCTDTGETIPSLLNRLRERSGLTKNITGFIDAPKASRPAFKGANTALKGAPGAIDKFHGNVDTMLASRTTVEDRRRAVALLDVRAVRPPRNLQLEALDLATPRQPGPSPLQPLQWMGTNWKVHLNFLQYLDDFLKSAQMNKV